MGPGSGVHLGVHNARKPRSLPVTLGKKKGNEISNLLISLPFAFCLRIPWPQGRVGSNPAPGIPRFFGESHSADRQASDADALRLDHNDGSRFQRRADSIEIGQEEREQRVRATIRHPPKEKQRRVALGSKREDRAEVRISREKDPVLFRR